MCKSLILKEGLLYIMYGSVMVRGVTWTHSNFSKVKVKFLSVCEKLCCWPEKNIEVLERHFAKCKIIWYLTARFAADLCAVVL